MPERDVKAWASARGIAVRLPSEYERNLGGRTPPEVYDPEESPCVDASCTVARVPRYVLLPNSTEQVAHCAAFLAEEAFPFKVRAGGRSTGGQVLAEGIPVLDVSGLRQIHEDRADQEAIRIGAGTRWREIAIYLHGQGRRPVVLTEDWASTVGGSLAAGGFGDSSHLYGLQVDSVLELEIVTLDGGVHRVHPGDELFDYTLAGRGQLGIVTEVVLRTLTRPWSLSARLLRWHTLQDFVEDAFEMALEGRVEFLRARASWEKSAPVKGVAGVFDPDARDGGFAVPQRARASAPTRIDYFDQNVAPETESPTLCAPSLAVLLPLPSGLAPALAIHAEAIATGLHRYMKRGAPVLAVPNRSTLPLAPLTDAPATLAYVLQPRMPYAEVQRFQPHLDVFAKRTLNEKGKVYLGTWQPRLPRFAERQFGPAFPAFRTLKTRWDPKGLLNPGLL